MLQAENVLVKTQAYTVNEDGTRTTGWNQPCNYFYNSDMQNTLTYGNGFTDYTYDEQGRVATKIEYTDYAGAFNRMTQYTYDADGNVTKKVETTQWGSNTYEYSNFENGEYKHYSVLYSGTDTPTEYDVLVSFDEKGRLARRYGQSQGTIEIFTYDENGVLTQKESDYVADGNLDSQVDAANSYSYAKYEYTYNTDGTLARIRTSRNSWNYATSAMGQTVSEEDYTYEDLKGEWAAKNFTAEAGEANTVKLSWDAVSGADSYKVIYPVSYKNDTLTTSDTKLTTESLVDGTYSFVVVPVVSGAVKNVVPARQTVVVKDNTKVAATDFDFVEALHDTITIVYSPDYSYDQEVYTVTVCWKEANPDLVTDHVLSYGPNSYDTCHVYDITVDENGLYTGKANLQSYTCVDTDWTTYETTPKDVTLGIYLIYKTGLADLSNTKVVRVAEVAKEKDPVALDAVRVNSAVHSIYNLNGQRQQNLKTPGLYIVDGRKVQIR